MEHVNFEIFFGYGSIDQAAGFTSMLDMSRFLLSWELKEHYYWGRDEGVWWEGSSGVRPALPLWSCVILWDASAALASVSLSAKWLL